MIEAGVMIILVENMRCGYHTQAGNGIMMIYDKSDLLLLLADLHGAAFSWTGCRHGLKHLSRALKETPTTSRVCLTSATKSWTQVSHHDLTLITVISSIQLIVESTAPAMNINEIQKY